ncbi:hypothetical protein ACFLY9_01895 [Patescibacteria group bacterium]
MNYPSKSNSTLTKIGCFLIVGLLFTVFFLWYFDIINFGNNNSSRDSGDSTNYNPLTDTSEASIKAALRNIQTSLDIYFADWGEYPYDLDTLVEEGYIMNVTIAGSDITYDISGDYYTLSATLPSGEEYSLKSF